MTMGVVVACDTIVRSTAAARLQKLGRQKGRGKGRGPEIAEESLFADIMREARVLLDERDLVVVVDARMFHDPTGAADRHHTGLHINRISEVVRNPEFRPWMADVRQRIERAVVAVPPAGRVHVLVYCRKGVHRSVACGAILHHIFQQEAPLAPRLLRRVQAVRGECHPLQDVWG